MLVRRVLPYRVTVAHVPAARVARAVPRVRVPRGHVPEQRATVPEQPAAQFARVRPLEAPPAVAGNARGRTVRLVVRPVREGGGQRDELAAAPGQTTHQPVIRAVVRGAHVPPHARLAGEVQRAHLALFPHDAGHRLLFRQRFVQAVGADRETVIRTRRPSCVQECRLRKENRPVRLARERKTRHGHTAHVHTRTQAPGEDHGPPVPSGNNLFKLSMFYLRPIVGS